ncbi:MULTISPECIES: dihydroorotase [unclassified Polaribacter]|uniref:dihydroorotase n=1 Tax=unclassified Polaribacter TaxID=196858 RepID=UPI0011BEE4EA|nr:MULTISPECIES: dihydroorotase [unclassified Polaribacter]TXD50891.1 dihydroorotase [Polaribacter sp. IC063]TXD57564.1 dihydroorotase [Polaribacter sp. IC066]
MSTLLKNATIIDATSPFHHQKKDILIRHGKFEKIEDSIPEKSTYTVITLDNLHVSCGWFDTSVSLGEPGFEERETIENGLKVAAKSGFTAIAVNANTEPVIDSKADVAFLINQATNSATKLYPIAALTRKSEGVDMAELYDMQQAGAIAFGDYNKPIENDNLMKVALLYAQNFNGLVLSFPKNNAISSEGIANEGINSTRLGLKGIPALAEHLQIARDLFLLEYTGGKLHIPTISSAKSVDLIKEAKKKGLQVTCSVAAHHLVLTDDELHGFNSNFKTNPPLRTKEDIKALQKGVKLGVIDVITSDHNPIDLEHKKVEFSEAKDGVIGLESFFGVVNSVLNLDDFIDCLTVHPKAIFGIKNHGIAAENIADITLFNPTEEIIFTKKHILSTSINSPFINRKLKGTVYGIFANNQLFIH